VYVCAYAQVHVYTAVCTCHPHTTHIHAHTTQTLGYVSMYASFETMSREPFMCNVRCTAQIGYSWESIGIEGAGVRNYSSLSDQRGTTS